MWPTLVAVVAVLGAVNTASVEEAIVYPRVVAARDGSGAHEVTFSAMGKNFALNLKPSAPVLSEGFLHIYADKTGRMIKESVDMTEIQAHLFQDPTTGAAVHLSNDGLHPIMTGLLSEDYRIMPADYHPRSALEPVPHKVYKASLPLGGKRAFDYLMPPLNFTETAAASHAGGTERQRDSSMVVETLVTLDSAHTKVLKEHGIKPEHYAMIFMNGVQCKFNQVSNPKVTVKLARLVSNQDASWEPYVEKNRRGDKVQGNNALDAYRDYMSNWQKNDPDLNFDLGFLLTGLDMYSGDDTKDNGVAGLAWVAGACGTYKYGMAEDRPAAYEGVFATTHEIGHSLGCPHDGTGKAGEYGPGHPGSDRCPWSEGYIMSYVDGGLKRHMFSSCCVDCIRWFSGRDQSSCTKQHDHQNRRNPWAHYPGNEIDEKTFCANIHGDDKVKVHQLDNSKPENNCRLMCCPSSVNYCYVYDKLDGHPCDLNGSQGQCQNRHCVPR